MRKKVKRKKKHHLNRLKTRVGLFRYFFADLFPIFNNYY